MRLLACPRRPSRIKLCRESTEFIFYLARAQPLLRERTFSELAQSRGKIHEGPLKRIIPCGLKYQWAEERWDGGTTLRRSMNVSVAARPLAYAQAGFDFGNCRAVVLGECFYPFRFG